MTYQERLDECHIEGLTTWSWSYTKAEALCQELINENIALEESIGAATVKRLRAELARLRKRDAVVVQWLDMDMGLRFGGWLKAGLALIDVEQDRVDYFAALDEQKEK